MTPYARWAEQNPQDDAEARAGVARGGMQWFEDNGSYPRMFYKVGAPNTDAVGNITNLFGGVACNTITAGDADEAAVLEAEGWTDTPAGATAAAAAPSRGNKAA